MNGRAGSAMTAHVMKRMAEDGKGTWRTVPDSPEVVEEARKKRQRRPTAAILNGDAPDGKSTLG
jgi:hypothetical protein